MSASAEDARIRALRPARQRVDPWRPLGALSEHERTPDGIRPVLTIFLAGSECPFTCVFCDLWQYTIDGSTPEGAIPAQIEAALAEAGVVPNETRLKLYNASNFFDRRAVPPVDLPRIADLVAGFERVVVECHPRLVDSAVFEFSERIGGRLEVAMGLETAHPGALRRLNKRMSKEDYDRAAGALAERGIPHRVFVLLGAPFLESRQSIDWAVVSTAYASGRGAETVALIPVRGGNGELERLENLGLHRKISLAQVESAFGRALSLPGEAVVQLDLWDLERLSDCGECFVGRRERLERMNLSGTVEDEVECVACATQGTSRAI